MFKVTIPLCWLSAALGISTILSETNFTTTIQEGTWFVKFYAPWCRYSKRLAPEWVILSTTMDNYRSKNFFFGEVDCDANGKLCTDNHIDGYPTLLLFNKGKRVEEFDENSVQDLKAKYIAEYVKKQAKFFKPKEIHSELEEMKPKATLQPNLTDSSFELSGLSTAASDRDEPINTGFVLELDAMSYDLKLQSMNPWIVLFYSPNCPHCRALEPLYIEAALASKGRINFAKVNCIENSNFCEGQGVLGVPDMRILLHGQQLDKKVGELSMDKLLKFVRMYYAPVVKRKTIQEVLSLINPSQRNPSSDTPFLVLTFKDEKDALEVRNITDSLIGTSLSSDVLIVQDPKAHQVFKLESDSFSAFSIQNSRTIEFLHPLDYVDAFRAWVGSNQLPLANELQLQLISDLELLDPYLVIGMYAKDTGDVVDSHQLRQLVLESNFQYLKTIGQNPTLLNTTTTRPTVFSYIKGPIEHESRQTILPKLKLPYEKIQKQVLENSSDQLFVIVDSLAGSYYYLKPNSEHKFSADAIVSSLKDFQLGRLEAQPLIEKATGSGFLFYSMGAVVLIGGLIWYFKRSRRLPKVKYSRL